MGDNLFKTKILSFYKWKKKKTVSWTISLLNALHLRIGFKNLTHNRHICQHTTHARRHHVWRLLLVETCTVANPEGFGGFDRIPLLAPPPHPSLKILWKWNNLVSVRPNSFLFMGYLGKCDKSAKRHPPPPLLYEPLFRNPWSVPDVVLTDFNHGMEFCCVYQTSIAHLRRAIHCDSYVNSYCSLTIKGILYGCR